MLKKIVVATLVLTTLSMAFASETQASVSASSPLKLSVWPGVWTWPDNTIYGMSLGLPASYSNDKNTFVGGLDIAILFSQTIVKGAQISILNMGENSIGAQIALANAKVSKFKGAQVGAYNEYTASKGFQMGVINKADSSSRGVQVGLVNFMDGGLFPVFPFFNFNCKPEPAKQVTPSETTPATVQK